MPLAQISFSLSAVLVKWQTSLTAEITLIYNPARMSTMPGIHMSGGLLHLLIFFHISCSSMCCPFCLPGYWEHSDAVQQIRLEDFKLFLSLQKLFFFLSTGASGVRVTMGSSPCEWESVLFL